MMAALFSAREGAKVTLLERGKGGVKLTSDGMKLLPFARSICGEVARLQSQVDELRGLRAGLIRVGALSGAAAGLLPGWAEAFLRSHPNIDFQLLVGEQREIEDWIFTGRVDFGILDLPADPELETVFLEQDPLLAVLPEDHPDAAAEVFPVSGFVDLPFLLLEKENRAEASELFESCGITPHIRFTTWDEQTILSMVERGLGVSILPALALKRCAWRVAARRLDVPAYRNLGVALRSRRLGRGGRLSLRGYLTLGGCLAPLHGGDGLGLQPGDLLRRQGGPVFVLLIHGSFLHPFLVRFYHLAAALTRVYNEFI